MELQYRDIAFDDFVKTRQGSHDIDLPRESERFELDPRHRHLIRQASHFYISTVTGSGWPYVQHRGGPVGFVHVLSPTRLGWLELRGNHQYVTTGNVDRDGRVCLFFVDYATRSRLKVFGTARVVECDEDPELIATLGTVPGSRIRGHVERAMLVDVLAADANCAKQIRPRYTREQVEERIDLYRQDIAQLKAKVAGLERQLGDGCGR